MAQPEVVPKQPRAAKQSAFTGTGANEKIFDLVVDECNNGQARLDLSKALREVTSAVRTSGKKGKVVFTMIVKPARRGEVTSVEIEDDIKVTCPQVDRAKSIFFVDRENNLCRENPNQPELPLEESNVGRPSILE